MRPRGDCPPDGPGLELEVVFALRAGGVDRAPVKLERNDPVDPRVTVDIAGDKRP